MPLEILWECSRCKTALVKETTEDGDEVVYFDSDVRSSGEDGDFESYFGATQTRTCGACGLQYEIEDFIDD